MPYKDQKSEAAVASQKRRDATWDEKHPGRKNEACRRFYYRNQAAMQERARLWYHANRAKCLVRMRVGHLRRLYGLTPEQYSALGSACEICGASEDIRVKTKTGKKFRLAVDHCHDTKKIRGLLCGSCNSAIGYFKHDIDLLKKAIEYLERTA